jgi:hypothetical protein
MSNVFQLVRQQKQDSGLNPNANLTIAVAEIVTSSAELGRSIEELLKHFDAVERIIEGLRDKELRNRHKQSIKLSREALTRAADELSLQIRKLPGLEIRATLE